MSKVRLAITALMLLLCVAETHAQVSSKAALLDQWQANWAGVSRLDVCFERDWSLGEVREGQVPFISYRFRCEPGTAVWWQSHWGDGNGATTSYASATGESRMRSSQKLLWRSMSQNYARDGGTDWMLFMLRSPYPSSSSEYYLPMDLGGLLSDDGSSLRAERDNVNGRPAAVLDWTDLSEGSSLSMTVWIDLERNAVPLRWEYGANLPGGPLTRADLFDFVEINGSWFSTRMQVSFGGGLAGEVSEIRVHVCADGAELIQTQAAAEPPLIVPFYDRAPVVDADTGGFYVVDRPRDVGEAVAQFAAAGRETGNSRDDIRVTLGVLASGSLLGLAVAVVWPLMRGVARRV